MKRKNLHLPANVALPGISSEERTFVMLYSICGFSGADAYIRSFKNSTATRGSAAALSSRLLGSERIQNAIRLLYADWLKGDWDFHSGALKDT